MRFKTNFRIKSKRLCKSVIYKAFKIDVVGTIGVEPMTSAM